MQSDDSSSAPTEDRSGADRIQTELDHRPTMAGLSSSTCPRRRSAQGCAPSRMGGSRRHLSAHTKPTPNLARLTTGRLASRDPSEEPKPYVGRAPAGSRGASITRGSTAFAAGPPFGGSVGGRGLGAWPSLLPRRSSSRAVCGRTFGVAGRARAAQGRAGGLRRVLPVSPKRVCRGAATERSH